MEESDNDTIGDDLTTSPKPDIDFANNKPHVDVQARDSVIPNRSEITTIVSEQASKAPPPTYHAVRSEQLAERVLHKKKQQEIRQANTNEITGSTPKSRDQEVQFSNKDNKSVCVSPVSGCVEVNSIRVCQNDEVPVLTQHDVFSKLFDSSKGHTCSNVSSVEEGTNFQDNNNKVVFQCHVAQRFEENSVVSSKEIQVLPAEANMYVLSELRPCTTEPVIHVSKPNLQESVVFHTVLETEFSDTDVVQSPCTFIEPVAFCRELHVETATSCVLDSKFCATCHSPETEVNSNVNSDKVHANVMHPSSHIHCETRNVSENPGVSQVKLVHFLLRILCSYYGKDTLKENLLSFLRAKNTRVKQAIGVSIPSAHCTEDDQNCLKEIESSVQKVDLQKADPDPTKFTTDNLPVCSDVSEDHLLTSKVKVDCLNDVSEVNNRFIALVTQDTLPLSRDTNNISVNGTVCDTELTFLVDTVANVTAIKADVWRQIPPPTKHPPSQTTISYINSTLNNNVVAPFLIWLIFLTRLRLFYWHFFTPHTGPLLIAASRLRNTESSIAMLCLSQFVPSH